MKKSLTETPIAYVGVVLQRPDMPAKIRKIAPAIVEALIAQAEGQGWKMDRRWIAARIAEDAREASERADRGECRLAGRFASPEELRQQAEARRERERAPLEQGMTTDWPITFDADGNEIRTAPPVRRVQAQTRATKPTVFVDYTAKGGANP